MENLWQKMKCKKMVKINVHLRKLIRKVMALFWTSL